MKYQEPAGVVKVEGNLSCNERNIVEFKILSQVSNINYKNHSPGLEENRPCIVQGSALHEPWDTAMKDNRAQKSCLIFKDNLIKAQDWSFLTLRKTSKYGTRPQKMDTETDYLKKGRYCLSMQGCRHKSQSPAEPKTS